MQSFQSEQALTLEGFSPRFLRRHERAFYDYLVRVRPGIIVKLRREKKLNNLLDHVNDVLFHRETEARAQASERLGPVPMDVQGKKRRRQALEGAANAAVLVEMERWVYRVLSDYEVV